MANIHGTKAAEKILPGFTSATVTGGSPTIDADTIFAGGGNDVVRGGLGVDQAFLGGGNDRYIWTTGDGNDVVNGGGGIDTLDVRGSGAQNLFALFKDSSGNLSVSDAFGSEAVTLGNIERAVFHLLGGNDVVTIGMLGGTPLQEVVIDLAGALGGNAGDGFRDTVDIDASNGANNITLTQTATTVKVLGIGARIVVRHADDGSRDELIIEGHAGNDRIDASATTVSAPALVLEGGRGNDTVIGGAGRDILFGDEGKDVLVGGKGADFLEGGAGADTLIGGQGKDSFDFADVDNVDKVVDFKVGIDKIGLSAGTFTLAGDTVSAGQFHIGAAAADADDHIIYNPNTGALYYDADGLGGADAVEFARLAKHLALTHTDFQVLF